MQLRLAAIRVILPLISSVTVASPEAFPQTLYPVFEAAACRTCHNSDGVASGTRLLFPETGASTEVVRKFGLSLVRLVDSANPEKSLLLTKPTNRLAHAGGERIKPGSDEEKLLGAWVRELAALPQAEAAKASAYSQELAGGGPPLPLVGLRRLTHAQYNNTVRDLLKESAAAASQFPPEDFVHGFRNQYQSQSISPLLMEAYSAAAERLARNAFRNGDARGLVGCQPSLACRKTFVREFGLRAFRRPLTGEEAKRYEALFARESEFFGGARIVVESMLQSPHFLFRLEAPTVDEWRPYAAASRLSYSLWDTMPDAGLLQAAERGRLNNVTGIVAEARRLLADPKARPALDEFVAQWMRFDRLLTASKDRRRFPWYNRETAVAMTEEARRFVADLVWNNRDFMELFTSPHGYVNADLANVYGVAVPAEDFSAVRFTAESERAGILGQALFLALTAKPDETSPTARGLFVREQFLCQHVADPPPGVSTTLPAVTEARPQTNRERLAEHTTNPSCAGCHNLIDPIGFGFEKFDAAGGRREKLKVTFAKGDDDEDDKPKTKSVELALDTKGWLAGVKASEFASPKELGAVLARTAICQECIVKQYFRWISGRMEAPSDGPLIKSVAGKFKDSGFRFQEMVVALIQAREEQVLTQWNGRGAGHVASHHQTH